MSVLGCSLSTLVPSPNSFLDTLVGLSRLMGDLLNDIFGRVTKPLGQFSLESLTTQNDKMQRQILGFLSSGSTPFNSRVNIRSMFGLPALCDNDSKAIEQLSGSIKRESRRKTCVTRLIRSMRDYDGY